MVIVVMLLCLQQSAERRAALDPNRILVAQQALAMEVRAQHREIERVQPESHLTPEELAANHKAELDRLVTPR